MGVFDKIAGVFVERSESPKDEKTIADSKQTIMTGPNILGSLGNLTSTVPSGPSSEDLSKFVKHFDELFDGANMPGPDYYEFIKMSEAMGNLPENVKYPAVFNALKIQGLTKAGLLNSAQEYIKIIDNDAAQFNAAIDQKVVSGIEASKKNVEDLKKTIQSKTEMIAALQNEIAQHTQEIQNSTLSIQEEENKLMVKISSYKIACDAKKSSITSDIQKINSLIQ